MNQIFCIFIWINNAIDRFIFERKFYVEDIFFYGSIRGIHAFSRL
jgi:hypothetical protein